MSGPGGLSPEGRVRFEETVLPHLDAAYNLARHLLRDADRAQDAVQDSFLRAMTYFDGFRGGDSRAWLLAIVRNTCFDRLERERRRSGDAEFNEEIHGADQAGPSPETSLRARVASETVERALGELPPELREAVVLRELEGLSYKEIAQVAGVPVGTVMSRLSRGRERLHRVLGADGGKEGDRAV